MIDNPIVDEIHRIREQMLAEFNGDLDALMKDFQRRADERARAASPTADPPTLNPAPTSQPAKKVC